MKIIVFLTILLAAISIGFGQVEPISVAKLESLRYVNLKKSEIEALKATTEEFIRRLESEREPAKGVVTVAHGFKFDGPCIDRRIIPDERVVDIVKAQVAKHPASVRRKIEFVGFDTELSTRLEFWVVPKGARRPESSRIVHTNFPCCCSEIKILGPTRVKAGTAKLELQLSVKPESKRTKTDPAWSISEGKIVTGQGTKRLVIDLKGVVRDHIDVTVSTTPPNHVCNCPITAGYRVWIERN